MSPDRKVSSLAGVLIVLAAAALLRGQTTVSAPVAGITHDEVQKVLEYSGDRRTVGPGDIVVVPAGVPHGFDDITDHLDYVSVRPDTMKTLPAGYVHPALRR
jgi:uncharacterized RmlC-like cupin family protein